MCGVMEREVLLWWLAESPKEEDDQEYKFCLVAFEQVPGWKCIRQVGKFRGLGYRYECMEALVDR